MTQQPPLPPPELARRVGVPDHENPLSSFDELGRGIKQLLVGLEPEGWFEGKRILDFGCGPGKVLRHFLAEAEQCEFFGCDIHEPSISWLQDHLSPPLTVFVCSEAPPLPCPDEHFDLVWAMSVFTHMTSYWSDWLLELHRVLRPGGRLVSTFLGEGMSQEIAGEPWDPSRIGMNVLREWQPWDHGGPSVQHSEWWLREHWGRAFEVEHVDDGPEEHSHGVIVLSKRPVTLARDALIEPARDDLRELTALSHNVSQLVKETSELYALWLEAMAAASTHNDTVAEASLELQSVRADRDAARAMVDVMAESRSWKLTQPLRAVAARADLALAMTRAGSPP